ncbi:MBL fold metallo-hydrolase [Rhizorhapis suberifaciens]|uniref:Glyoxylase-like metal-dependent hydrolase (Beta-lactamase superfamily II) n=1 Tax=Rhizorhapis suberifaciens TaxID=13656 RepID=A0A840HUN0_9SPHN|nr:MBL fold metallo-hydrolase [Rhizorhapis suberifaciens]MBB4641972.1 glyoxylase-like metal-dependent hydrolase (beta-lactamase superfamily II) [Rhizorhapis suberifaciens]
MDLTEFPTGELMQLSPLVARVLAPNPSPFTYTGTQSYIVGTSDLAVIDPGPEDPDHLAALLRVIAGRPVRAIMTTHTHRDHSPASRPLAEATGAGVIGCAPLAIEDDGPRADAAFDSDYAPHRVLLDGECIEGTGWTLQAVGTPGHTSNHLCFALLEEKALFTGDHVMGWSTSVISPPDGDMAAYMASMQKLLGRDDAIYYPAHGEPVNHPQRWVRSMMGHRKHREGQILRHLRNHEAASIVEIVEKMYKGVDRRLHGAAGRSVLAHLLDLQARHLVISEKDQWKIAA